MHLVIRILLLLAIMLPLPGWSAGVFHEPLREMRRVDATIAEPTQKAPLLEKTLASIVTTAEHSGFAALGDDDVRDLYDGARMTAYYSYTQTAASDMRRAWNELDRRGIAPFGSADEMIETYVAARLFAEAQTFYRARRNAVGFPPPKFNDLREKVAQPTMLEISADGSKLSRREFSRMGDTMVVVVGSPWCHFSRAATAAVEGDPELASLMATHATWVIPQQIVRDVRSVGRWNREHPASAMALIFRQSEWPFVRSSATPAFYFFRDGRLVSSFSGWSGPDQIDDLMAGLRIAGVTRASSSLP